MLKENINLKAINRYFGNKGKNKLTGKEIKEMNSEMLEQAEKMATS